jgi:peptide deformylase
MSVLEILRYPDPRLRLACEPVAAVDDRVRQLVADLGDTMQHVRGAGLSANQVGERDAVFVLDPWVFDGPRHSPPVAFINPVVEVSGDEVVVGDEGCLSLPGAFVPVRRSARATVRAMDVAGREFVITGDGQLARALQHERDHLRGLLLLDVVGPVTRKIILNKLFKRFGR